jgi:hypothetical protein
MPKNIKEQHFMDHWSIQYFFCISLGKKHLASVSGSSQSKTLIKPVPWLSVFSANFTWSNLFFSNWTCIRKRCIAYHSRHRANKQYMQKPSCNCALIILLVTETQKMNSTDSGSISCNCADHPSCNRNPKNELYW